MTRILRPAGLGAGLLLALLLAPGAQGQNAAERLPVCLACHGANGTSSIEKVPSLGAMPVNYVLTQLYLFREKIRVADPMNAMAAGLSDDDLRSLGEAINKLPAPEPAVSVPDAERESSQALVERYHCNSCHGPDLGGQATIPRIAGQREDYVQASLVGYKSNTRKGYSPAMNEAAQDVADGDIPLLARYVASLK